MPRLPDAPGVPAEVRRIAEELMPLFYADVRRLAHHERHRVGAGDTLQTTALIHEAYLKLFRSPSFNDRAHFLRASALAMRHVLINHARAHMAEKRGAGTVVESLASAIRERSGNEARMDLVLDGGDVETAAILAELLSPTHTELLDAAALLRAA